MLRALIWKDIRANRFALLLALILVVATYGVVGIFGYLDASMALQPLGRRVGELLRVGSLMAYGVGQLSMAVLAGNLIAGERVNRSAEFLAYLPASRGKVLCAKALVLAGAAAALLVVSLLVGGLAALFGEYPGGDGLGQAVMAVVLIAAFGFCAAGVGWLGSCGLQSSAAAMLFAILVPWGLSILVMNVTRGEASSAIWGAANLATGSAGFLFGTWHYLHRAEP
jgi:ABC-type transport system involved in multi-copper enzyme maturation permease subunit